MTQVTLYHTQGCHLCEKARDILWPLLSQGYQFHEVDIADTDELLEVYGLRIPVISVEGRELGWPFDQASLMQFLMDTKQA
jgi:glutaredoxin